MRSRTDRGRGVPVYSRSMADPFHLGIDEDGRPVGIELLWRNILIGGEPGGGKSNAEAVLLAQAALCPDVDLELFDGNLVGFGLFAPIAERLIGPDINQAIEALEQLQGEMNARYEELLAAGLRKIVVGEKYRCKVTAFDEVAFYSATVGTSAEQKRFVALSRDLVARGRAAGMPVIMATQRPSADIIPTSLRDLFAWRLAFRCTTEASSDVILGTGWAKQGYCATDIDPLARGVGWLLAEGGIPQRIKTPFLSDDDIRDVVNLAAHLRGMRHGGVAA